MSYRRRSVFEILLDIIKNARTSINQTKLCSKANISHRPFKKYVKNLEERGFIMKINPPTPTHKRGKNRLVKYHYINTYKGNELIGQISQEPLSELFDIVEEISK